MKACICGAGIAGLATAWWLDRLGWEVELVELSQRLRDDGYMIDFFGWGYDAAEMMGLLPRLKDLAHDVKGVAFVDSNGDRKAWLSYQLVRDSQDDRLFPLLRGDLERVLFEALPERVRVSFGRTVTRIQIAEQSADVTFDDGRRDRVDLVVGADGMHSRVRELAFGPETKFLRFLGLHAASYFIEDEALRGELGDGEAQLFSVPGRQLTLYPVGARRIAALFTHEADDSERPPAPCRALLERYGDLGWHVPRVLAHCPRTEPFYYDSVSQVEVRNWNVGPVVLVGDSCQAVSLLAGQGASMAVGAACILGSELTATPSVRQALTNYASRVRPAILQKQAAGRRTARWFVPSSRFRIGARNLLMNVTSKRPFQWMITGPLRADGATVITRRDRERLAPHRVDI